MQRAIAASQDTIHNFFVKLHTYFQTKGLLDLKDADIGQRLRNCDETGICTSVSARKVWSKEALKLCRKLVVVLGGNT